MLLTKKSGAAQARARSPFVHSLQRGLSHALAHHGPPRLPAPLGPGRGRGHRRLVADAGEEGQGRRGQRPGHRPGQDRGQAHGLHPLLGGLRHRCGGGERRLGAPGAGVRFAPQPGRALRQGRGDPRARPRRVPPALSDEAGQRQVRAHQLGHGAQRDQRQDAGAAQGQRPRLRVTGSARPSTTTSRPTCCASSSASSAATTATTRRASATPPRWPAWPTHGATAP